MTVCLVASALYTVSCWQTCHLAALHMHFAVRLLLASNSITQITILSLVFIFLNERMNIPGKVKMGWWFSPRKPAVVYVISRDVRKTEIRFGFGF